MGLLLKINDMKALQYNQYGGTDVLQWNELATPTPGPGQVLVQVKAASINPTDTKIRLGYLKFPGSDHFPRGMGMDFAGVVVQTGPGVNQAMPGDRVMGYLGAQGGAFAEYTLAEAVNTFLIPGNLSVEEATTLPMNAATALKVVNSYLKPTAGKTILINGASGGIGLFVVQYCKQAGALVTGTASGDDSLRILTGLGVDQVVDYKTTDILQSGQQFDAILDMSGKLDFEQAKNSLNEQGEFSTMVPKGAPGQPGRTDGSRKENRVFAVPGPDEFATSQAMAGAGTIRTFIGRSFPMQDAIEAMQLVESGQLTVVGKVILVA